MRPLRNDSGIDGSVGVSVPGVSVEVRTVPGLVVDLILAGGNASAVGIGQPVVDVAGEEDFLAAVELVVAASSDIHVKLGAPDTAVLGVGAGADRERVGSGSAALDSRGIGLEGGGGLGGSENGGADAGDQHEHQHEGDKASDGFAHVETSSLLVYFTDLYCTVLIVFY